jgi:hypothetical protein
MESIYQREFFQRKEPFNKEAVLALTVGADAGKDLDSEWSDECRMQGRQEAEEC